MVIVARTDHPFTEVANFRFGDETSTPIKFSESAEIILSKFLADETFNSVLEHGCWCRGLRNSEDMPWEDWHGPAVVDELDLVCKRWYMARRCIVSPWGQCENDPMTGSYDVGFDAENCPFKGDFYCGVEVGLSDINPEYR